MRVTRRTIHLMAVVLAAITGCSDSITEDRWPEYRVVGRVTDPLVSYSLNIANNGYDRADVLARPTLVALDGQPAHFFSGEELSLAVSGQFSGSIIDKKVGVELAVTPTLLDDNTVLLSVNATRSFLNTSFLPEATSALRTTQQRVTTSVAVQLGQTVVLSGLSEHQVEDSRIGVPVLQELPGVRYFFSQRDHLVFETSTLVLLTPRRVGAVTQVENGTYVASSFDSMAAYFPELQRRTNTLEQIGGSSRTTPCAICSSWTTWTPRTSSTARVSSCASGTSCGS